MRALVLLGLAACYNPRPLPGAPCSDTEPCPRGQACIDGACGGAPVDGAIDAPDGSPVLHDRDKDGIDDAVDNCPDVANHDQGNEDGDKFGDACDPCPIEANDNPSDPDGDGVADGCDPRPMMPGDHIVVFQGFHQGVPADWLVVGTVTPGDDGVALTSVGGNHTAIVPPLPSIGNGTITASLIVDATVGGFDSATTVAMPYDPNADNGIFCEAYAPDATSSNGHYVSVWDSPAQMERAKRTFAWSIATSYRVSMTRTGNNYACSLTAPGGQPQTASGSTSSVPAASKPTVAVYGANARVAWMMVVSSP